MLLLYGSLIDKWGRKPILLSGLAISIVGALGCIWSDNSDILIVVNAFVTIFEIFFPRKQNVERECDNTRLIKRVLLWVH